MQSAHRPAPCEWKRSVFNRLAQVIVQFTREPGEIKLTARNRDAPGPGGCPATIRTAIKRSTGRIAGELCLC